MGCCVISAARRWAGALLRPGSPMSMSRPIFTDAYLGLDLLAAQRKAERQSVTNVQGFREQVCVAFETDGLQNVHYCDFLSLLSLDGEDDLHLAGRMLVAAMQPDANPPFNLPNLFKRFVGTGCLMGNLAVVREVWTDPAVAPLVGLQSTAVNPRRDDDGLCSHMNINTIYFTLLFRHGCLHELLDLYDTVKKGCGSLDLFTLAMAALHSLGKDDAYARATDLVKQLVLAPGLHDKPHLKPNVFKRNRALCLYAHMAINRGDYSMAYDLLSRARGVHNRLADELRVLILIRLGRLEDALFLIRQEDPNFTKSYCRELMQLLAESVQQQYEPHTAVAQDLRDLFECLDKSAKISDKTLSERVTQPLNYSRMKRFASQKI